MRRVDVRRGVDPVALGLAVQALRSGRLVAFPTETVYGIGAPVLDGSAVDRIFAVKGRPPDKPLSVLVADAEQARGLASRWPDEAEALSRAFWPGPLTIVVPATEAVPAIVRAGGHTVGVRVPDHPVVLALLQAVGPLAAPSANPSGAPAPIDADQVAAAFAGTEGIEVLLDGGTCAVGLASTVVDLSGLEPRIVRMGALSAEAIEACVGRRVHT